MAFAAEMSIYKFSGGWFGTFYFGVTFTAGYERIVEMDIFVGP